MKRGKLREFSERPVARMRVRDRRDDDVDGHGNGDGRRGGKTSRQLSLLNGEWEICLPTDAVVNLEIRGLGRPVEGWAGRLGLKGEFENQRRSSSSVDVVAVDVDVDVITRTSSSG